MQSPDIEERIKDICEKLIITLRGNKGEIDSAFIDLNLIELLHRDLEVYKEYIVNEASVSKDVVSTLFYTCTRFYNQSKYSKNSKELLKEFDRLYSKILMTFSIKGL